jgi:hypothetical protein
VVRGAVLKAAGIGAGMPGIVRTCPRSYGYTAEQQYTDYLGHEEDELNENKLTGRTMAANQVFWQVRKGDLIPASEPIATSVELSVPFETSEEQMGRCCRVSFVATKSDECPSRLSDLPNDEEIIHMDFKFSAIPESERRKLRKANSRFIHYNKASFKFELKVDSRVEIKVTAGDKVLVEKSTSL